MRKIPKLSGLWGLVLAVSAILLVPAVVVAGSLYLYVSTVSVTVTSGVKDVKPYSDQAATTTWDTESVSMDAGLAWQETVYLKNDGVAPITAGIRAEGNTAFGMVLFSPATFTLDPGEVQPIAVTIMALPDSSPGQYNFSVVIYE